MTIISTLVTSRFTAYASDSFITEKLEDGTYTVTEETGTKIVPVRRFRGAMSYFGWAKSRARAGVPDWSTVAWLREQAQQGGAFDSPGAFANALAQNLEIEIRKRPSDDPVVRGIGIHFSCYERIGGYWVPEVFLISNFENPTYRSLRPNGVGVTRNLHVGLVGIADTDIIQVDNDARLRAYQLLLDGLPGWWYNGDPAVFGPIAAAYGNGINQLRGRQSLSFSTWKEHADLARQPVEMVIRMFAAFSVPTRRVVGGKPHDLVISPTNDYQSSTGDG